MYLDHLRTDCTKVDRYYTFEDVYLDAINITTDIGAFTTQIALMDNAKMMSSESVSEIFTKVKDFLVKIWNGIVSFFKKIVNFFKDLFNKAFGKAKANIDYAKVKVEDLPESYSGKASDECKNSLTNIDLLNNKGTSDLDAYIKEAIDFYVKISTSLSLKDDQSLKIEIKHLNTSFNELVRLEKYDDKYWENQAIHADNLVAHPRQSALDFIKKTEASLAILAKHSKNMLTYADRAAKDAQKQLNKANDPNTFKDYNDDELREEGPKICRMQASYFKEFGVLITKISKLLTVLNTKISEQPKKLIIVLAKNTL